MQRPKKEAYHHSYTITQGTLCSYAFLWLPVQVSCNRTLYLWLGRAKNLFVISAQLTFAVLKTCIKFFPSMRIVQDLASFRASGILTQHGVSWIILMSLPTGFWGQKTNGSNIRTVNIGHKSLVIGYWIGWQFPWTTRRLWLNDYLALSALSEKCFSNFKHEWISALLTTVQINMTKVQHTPIDDDKLFVSRRNSIWVCPLDMAWIFDIAPIT